MAVQDSVLASRTEHATPNPVRLHYLDWLRVVAILGVFLFHAVHPFDLTDWHIKNAQTSLAITFIYAFLAPWGMPFFFLIAGTGSWYALRRRTPGQYARERFSRLLIPFVVGCLLLSPIVLYLEWSHQTQTGVLSGSFTEFLGDRIPGFTPQWFGAFGYHLWFLGFLFCFALLTLPLFSWLKGQPGRRFIAAMARLAEYRGSFLLLVLPLLAVQFGLRRFFPEEHNWADFLYLMYFFVLGHVLCADERFTRAVRRDWWVALIGGVAAFAAVTIMALSGDEIDVPEAPRTLGDHGFWALVTLNALCWTAFFLFVGMRFLNFSNRWLQYSQEAVLPFFVLHQPVIVVIAYFVVQWDAGIPVKLAAVMLGSFAATVGLYELAIRRMGPLRAMFGMPSRQRGAPGPSRGGVRRPSGGK